MAEGDEKKSLVNFSSIIGRFNRLWPKYVPYCGVFGYCTIATNSLHIPLVQQFLNKDTSHYFTNSAFVASHAGIAVYIYNRPSFSIYPRKERLLYSLFGSTIFNLGSILSWSILQVGLPKDEVGKGIVGFACGLTYLYIGYRYLQSLQGLFKRAFLAGQRRLAEEQCQEVKDRLERSHIEYEDQEFQVEFEDDMKNSGDEDFTFTTKIDESI